eukprot:gnl/TRDRNA2_/TRDRNA2_161091_c0_seq1.p1 gnl/TRDRNA2_/TRDRNA2_161091_c0~~gnl/TRDRNA2_/TRDRNA2_161091_c0_seq1.p1  ORF type:complete len:835 (+),score=135.38 gnl/TRDRNA2_/TRDRNA2_161091_c0_seq1:67-2571(+)
MQGAASAPTLGLLTVPSAHGCGFRSRAPSKISVAPLDLERDRPISGLSPPASGRSSSVGSLTRAPKHNPQRRKSKQAPPSTSLVWAARSVQGTFPGSLSLKSHLVSVDLSGNAISGLNVEQILTQLPLLRKLNLAENLLTTLACVVSLGVLPFLEDLDIRGNPCMPAGGRRSLLATLLVPELSPAGNAMIPATEVMRLSKAQSTKAVQEDVKMRVSCSTPNLRLPDPEPQPAIQERLYRSVHSQSNESVFDAEADARCRLKQFRALGKQQQSPPSSLMRKTADATLAEAALNELESPNKPPLRHEAALRRRVRGCCLPRAHLYQAPVGTDENFSGAGCVGWFARLIVLNGFTVTVQDLEDAADEVSEFLRCFEAGTFQPVPSRANTVPKKEPGEGTVELQRMRNENCHELLLRVRTEFLRRRRRLDQSQGGQVFYSDTFEKWRLRKNRLEDGESEPEDYEEYHKPPSVGIMITGSKLKCLLYQIRAGTEPAEERALKACEIEMWQDQRKMLKELEQGPVGEDEEQVDHEELLKTPTPSPSAEQLAREKMRRQLQRQQNPEPKKQQPTKTERPSSAPAGSRAKALKVERAWVTNVVPYDAKWARKELRNLDTQFPQLDAAASDDDDDADSKVGAALRRLRARGGSRGAPVSQGASRSQVKDQWLQQLREDYPDTFCRAKCKAERVGSKEPQGSTDKIVEEPESAFAVQEEPRADALLDGSLWVLNLHGDPLCEQDWLKREAWLSRTGRLWFGALQDAEGSAATLALGGHRVSELLILPARRGSEAVATIGGQPAFAMRIDFPGARFERKKFLAASTSEARDKWIMVWNNAALQKA